MLITFREATNRKTKCYWLRVFDVDVLISYETPVAFTSVHGTFRRNNDWGPTTGRHLREGGADLWTVVTDQREFEAKLDAAIMRSILTDREMVKQLITNSVAKTIAPELEHELG